MAFPWMVLKDVRRGAWVYFTFLLGCYIAYCTAVTVQAFRGRSAPAISLEYDTTSPWIFPDLTFQFGSVENGRPDQLFEFCCQVYSVLPDHTKFGSNRRGTSYLFHAENELQSWNGTIWAHSASQSPRQDGDYMNNSQYCTNYGNTDSICQVAYNYSKNTKTLEFTFLLSQIAYHGSFQEDNVFNIQFVLPRGIGELYSVVQGPEVYSHPVSLGAYQTLLLSRVKRKPLKRASQRSFVTVQAEYKRPYTDTMRTVSFILLNPEGTLIQKEIDPVSITGLLAKYGGFWFFIPLLFGLVFIPIESEPTLKRMVPKEAVKGICGTFFANNLDASEKDPAVHQEHVLDNIDERRVAGRKGSYTMEDTLL